MPPDTVVPLAEGAGLLPQVTRLVLRRSLDAVAQWRAAGRDVGIAVNLSALDLLDPLLPAQVADELEQRALPPHLLTLEITESTLMVERDRCAETLRRLRSVGVRLSVDDFGTGYSSLAYLRWLPVHEVKVDRSFVASLATSPADRAIVRAVVSLARDLDLVVVAEGVEDRAGWAAAAALGCDQVQGWELARPMPPEALLAWCEARAVTPGGPVPVVAQRRAG